MQYFGDRHRDYQENDWEMMLGHKKANTRINIGDENQINIH